MASYPVWTEDEWILVWDLFLRSQGHPTDNAVKQLQAQLRALASKSEQTGRRSAAKRDSYRSTGSIWSHVSWIRVLELGRPVGAAPLRLQVVSDQYGGDPAAIRYAASEILQQIEVAEEPPIQPAAELAVFLRNALKLLDDVVHTISALPASNADPEVVADYLAAWKDLNGGPLVESIIEEMSGPDAIEQLESVGLAGAQLALKRSGFMRAFEDWWSTRAFEALKRALRWADVVLGSMSDALPGPGTEVFKEFKESTEAMLEEAVPPGGFLPVAAPA